MHYLKESLNNHLVDYWSHILCYLSQRPKASNESIEGTQYRTVEKEVGAPYIIWMELMVTENDEEEVVQYATLKQRAWLNL